MTTQEINKIADAVAKRLEQANDIPVNLKQAIELTGFSSNFLYKNQVKLGAWKASGKIFFRKSALMKLMLTPDEK